MKMSEQIKSQKRIEKEASLRRAELCRAEKFMKTALSEAERALKEGEVPVGAVIARGDEIIAKAHNMKEKKKLATAHAEILAIQRASKKLGDWRLCGCEMFVTLEPCAMCAGAIASSRIQKVYFGAFDEKGGACGSRADILSNGGLNFSPRKEGGILKEECENTLAAFFGERRKKI